MRTYVRYIPEGPKCARNGNAVYFQEDDGRACRIGEGMNLGSPIIARDLPEAWFLAIKEVVADGYEYTIDRGSFEGSKRKELDLAIIQILNPSIRPLVPDVPPGMIPPTSMDYVEEYFANYIMGKERAEKEDYTYGEDIVFQVPKVIEVLRDRDYNTNQTCMTLGSSLSIYLDSPQCLKVIQIRIRYGKLHMIVYFRSWDLWSGFPTNLAAMQLLKEYILSEVEDPKLEDGDIIAISPGLHLYDYVWSMAKHRLGEE